MRVTGERERKKGEKERQKGINYGRKKRVKREKENRIEKRERV